MTTTNGQFSICEIWFACLGIRSKTFVFEQFSIKKCFERGLVNYLLNVVFVVS